MLCPVRMWLFSIVSLVFRVFSFTLIVTALRYWALPLYFFLLLGAIIIGAWANTDHESFVIIGSKSLLFTGIQGLRVLSNSFYFISAYESYEAPEATSDDTLLGKGKQIAKSLGKGEAPFQIFWFLVNISIVSFIAMCVKMGKVKQSKCPEHIEHGDPNLTQFLSFPSHVYCYMLRHNVGIVKEENSNRFDAAIAIIVSSGLLSILLFFLMKHHNWFDLPQVVKEKPAPDETIRDLSPESLCVVPVPSLPIEERGETDQFGSTPRDENVNQNIAGTYRDVGLNLFQKQKDKTDQLIRDQIRSE